MRLVQGIIPAALLAILTQAPQAAAFAGKGVPIGYNQRGMSEHRYGVGNVTAAPRFQGPGLLNRIGQRVSDWHNDRLGALPGVAYARP